MRANRPGEALRLLDAYTAAHTGGELVPERRAQRIFVLCALGRRAEARTDVERFLRDLPRSPLAARVRRTCGVEAP